MLELFLSLSLTFLHGVRKEYLAIHDTLCAEAGGNAETGILVLKTTLNRVRHAYGSSLSRVMQAPGQYATICQPSQRAPWQPPLALAAAVWPGVADMLPAPPWWRQDVLYFVATYRQHRWFGAARKPWTRKLRKVGTQGRHVYCRPAQAPGGVD